MLIILIPYKSGAKSGAYYDTYLLGVAYPFSFCLVHRIILNISRFCGIIIPVKNGSGGKTEYGQHEYDFETCI